MLRTLQITLTVISLVAFTASAMASSYNQIDISTGIKADQPGNPVYAGGDRDAFWKTIATPNPQNLGQPYVIGLTGTFTAYTVIPGTAYINSNQTLPGIYEYERCFCLDNPEKAALKMELRADNQAEVFLNQYTNRIINVVHNDSFKKAPGTATVETGFVKGKNCVRVRVNNEGNVTGMAAKISVGGWGAIPQAGKCCEESSRLFLSKAKSVKETRQEVSKPRGNN